MNDIGATLAAIGLGKDTLPDRGTLSMTGLLALGNKASMPIEFLSGFLQATHFQVEASRL